MTTTSRVLPALLLCTTPSARDRGVHANTGLVICGSLMAQLGHNYRFIGPVTACPACGANAFETVVSMDEETHAISAYLLNATCAQCEARVLLATPVDEIKREPALNVKEEEEWD